MDYKSKKWKRIREKILRRDGYSCQYFKMFGKMVPANTVHHIYPCELYPEYQWCEWNLISLSNEAHNMMHERDKHKLTDKGEMLKIIIKSRLTDNDKTLDFVLPRPQN